MALIIVVEPDMGVGYFLGVHEGPNAFRWRSNPENLDAVLQPGMVITDEPGVYVPGKYGIRTENMLICKKWQQNEYGAFLHFEPLTLVPIDLDGVDLSLFNEKEKQLLTDYQQSYMIHFLHTLTRKNLHGFIHSHFESYKSLS